MSFVKVSELPEITEFKNNYLLVTTKEDESRKYDTNNLELSINNTVNDVISNSIDNINNRINETEDIVNELNSGINIIYGNIGNLNNRVGSIGSEINDIKGDIGDLNSKSYSIKIFKNGQELGEADSLDIVGGNLELVNGKLRISFNSAISGTSIKTTPRTIIEDNKINANGIIGDVIYNTARIYDDLSSEIFIEYTCTTNFNDIIFDEADNLNGKYAIVSYMAKI